MSAQVTYVGHSTIALELDGVRLLTDPVLRARVAHLARRVPAPEPGVVGNLDAVLISHAHADHLDLPSLARLAPACPVIVARGHAARLGAVFGEVIEVGEGDRVTVGALEVEATHARHDGRRVPVGRPVPAVGFLIRGSRRVYFAGDTDLFTGMQAIGREDLDLALLPVAGWGPRVPAGHLDPERAARAASLLRPKVAVPIHWGTYAAPGSRGGDPLEPPRTFASEAAGRAPATEVRILEPGQSTTF